MVRFGLALLLVLAGTCVAETPSSWKDSKSITLGERKVTLSEPVLVARSKGFLWFPTMTRLSGGEFFAVLSTGGDEVVANRKAVTTWSADGFTWSKPTTIDPEGDLYVESTLRLANGDELLFPFNLYPRPGGMGGAYQIVSGQKGKREVKLVKEGLVVTGWPRPDRSFNPKLGLAGFGFNGQTLQLKEGVYLATLYGYFKDAKRYSLVLAESQDGVQWKIRSVIADEHCKVSGGEGPCESALCRLKDGRLMCIYRVASGQPYGQSWSKNDGRTWTEPAAMNKVFSVQPSLAVIKDGTVVLSGGRPGLFAWLNSAGDGKDWHSVDVLAHHNACVPKERIVHPERTTSYTEVAVIDDRHVLLMYDRVPHGWRAIPAGSEETNSVWVVRLTIEPAR